MQEDEKKYEEAVIVARAASRVLKAVLWAFTLFAINLLEALSLDEIVTKPVLRATDQTQQGILVDALNYVPLLVIDTAISGVSPLVGLGLLMYGAASMAKVIPKIS